MAVCVRAFSTCGLSEAWDGRRGRSHHLHGNDEHTLSTPYLHATLTDISL
jgi:hypothetical protein